MTTEYKIIINFNFASPHKSWDWCAVTDDYDGQETDPIGYGATFVTTRSTRVATVPIGYADGLPRRVSNRARMLVRGRFAALLGRVCMDTCMIDVTQIDGASLGDEVVILGRQGDASIGPDELGRHADTISYEILTGLGKRVPRTYR